MHIASYGPQFCVAVLLLASLEMNPVRAQYSLAPSDPVKFAGPPGNPLNSIFSGPVHVGGPTIYSERRFSGELFAVGTSHVTSINYNLRANGDADYNLCCSVTATRSSPAVLDELTTGYFFFDPGDQLTFEAWTPAWTPDPFDPNSDPVRAEIRNLSMEFSSALDPTNLSHLGNFTPGSFTFATVPTVDPDDPNAADDDVRYTELAIYSASDHSPIAVTTGGGVARYRQVTSTLDVGEYYLALGGGLTIFTSRSIEARTVVGSVGQGDVYNLELNGDPLITSGILPTVDEFTYAPQLFTFSVTASISGDFNGDGAVNLADYTVWRDNLGGDAAALNGNGTSDPSGLVVAADYQLWRNSFGNASGAVAQIASSSRVPEPAAGLVLAVGAGLVGMLRYCRANATIFSTVT